MALHFPLLLLAAIATSFDGITPSSESARVEAVARESQPARSASEGQSLGQSRRLISSQALEGTSAESNFVASDHHRPGGLAGRDMWQVLGALGSVLALIFLMRAALLRTARHWQGAGGRISHGVIEILTRQPIARGQNLVLLKLDNRILLLHENTVSKSMTALSEITDRDEVAALLKQINGRDTNHADIHDAWQAGEVVDLTRKPVSGVTRFLSRSTPMDRP